MHGETVQWVIAIHLFSVFRNDTSFPYNKHDTVGCIDSKDEL